MEGLLRYDEKNRLVQVSPNVRLRDGATFWLRENARGVMASRHRRHFVFAWQTVVDPATASEYAFSCIRSRTLKQ
jgi:hypothetical protein